VALGKLLLADLMGAAGQDAKEADLRRQAEESLKKHPGRSDTAMPPDVRW